MATNEHPPSEKALTPKLRFPEFKDSPWSTRPLDQLCDRILEKVGDVRLTPVSITAGRGFVSQAEKFGRDISGAQYKNYIRLRRGEFAYNKGNSNLYPQGCVYQLKEFDEAAASNAFICFRLKNGNEPGFFEGLFAKNAHGLQLLKFLTSGARSDGLLNIKADEFFSVSLPVPPDPAEQRKIAACLTSLDELLAAEARKLEVLAAHKKGLMQQLFPRPGEYRPRLRFPEFRDAGEWERHPLGKLCKFVRGPFGGALKKEIFVPKGYAVYEQSHAIDNQMLHFRYFITKEKYEEMKRFAVQPNDLIMSCSGTMGKFAQLPENPVPGVINQALLKLTVQKSWNSQFVLLMLGLPATQSKLLTQSAGGAMKNVVGVPQLKEIELPMPREAEQQRIAACFSSLNVLIAAQSRKLVGLRAHKKALMQQLFPSPEGV